MAIRYAGSRNLIGYGRAQVFKPSGVPEIAERVSKDIVARRAAKRKAKKEFENSLEDVDISGVRNAELEGSVNLYTMKDDVLTFGSANMDMIYSRADGGAAYMEYQRRKDKLKQAVIMSKNQKEKDENTLSLMQTTGENGKQDFMNDKNMEIWKQTRNTSMLSNEWNASSQPFSEQEYSDANNAIIEKYYNVEEDENTGEKIYKLKDGVTQADLDAEVKEINTHMSAGKTIEGVGTKYNNIMPDFDINAIIRGAVEKIKPNQLDEIYKGQSKSSGHDMYEIKSSLMDETGLNAAKGAIGGHKYSGYIQKKIEQEAAANNMDIDEYLLSQAQPHFQNDVKLWAGGKAMRINLGSEQKGFHGTKIKASKYDFSYRGYGGQGVMGASTTSTTKDGIVASITPTTTGGTAFYYATPQTDAGYMVTSNIRGSTTGELVTDAAKIDFRPSTIESFWTSTAAFTGASGTKYKKGQIIPDEDQRDDNSEEAWWITGTTDKEKTPIAIRFSGTAIGEYKHWVKTRTTTGDNAFNQIMMSIGLTVPR